MNSSILKRVIGGSPNLLNLLIETENSEEPDDSSVTPIVAINLRLSEIEFTDVKGGRRNQIRNLEMQLKLLGRGVLKSRERAVAEAETAWRRASWLKNEF